jgi:outer membrane protein OmpA-like peptidoglycan-associated protein
MLHAMQKLHAIVGSRTLGVAAAGLALILAASLPAHAQSAYSSLNRQSVTVDLSALDRLGPAPTVPDGRFVLKAPARDFATAPAPKLAARSTHRSRLALHAPAHRNLARADQNRIERIGNVTIDYSALPPAAAVHMAALTDAGTRIVLHRPTASQTAEALPPSSTSRVQGPSDSGPRGPVIAAVAAAPVSPPSPVPSPSPVSTPRPQVAALPPSSLVRLTQPAPPESPAHVPTAGEALAATHPAIPPGADAKSDSGALRFAPGTADLRGDARFVLDGLAQTLTTKPAERVQLVAYASGGAATDDAIEARRVSLARAVAVRAYLIQHGVPSNRIDVRALGNRVEGGGPADRVDLVTLGQ